LNVHVFFGGCRSSTLGASCIIEALFQGPTNLGPQAEEEAEEAEPPPAEEEKKAGS